MSLKIGGSCTERTAEEKTELILTVKMETRYPVEGQFGSEFPAILIFDTLNF